MDGGGISGDGGTGHMVEKGGCCRVGGTSDRGASALLVALGLGLVFAARRRRP
jgi:MYXO-CTERM domain-containing protein